MAGNRQPPGVELPKGAGMDTTASLLLLVQKGDEAARDLLISRYLPALKRWAQGRLPSGARDLNDTDDLVQITLLRALDRLDEFVPRRKGAFFAYLRRILQNQIRDEIRRAGRRPQSEALSDNQPDGKPSPLEAAIGGETLEAYDEALNQLTEEQREAVLLRIELGFTHDEVAEAIGCPSANAARMLVSRALVRLAEVMDERRPR